jgi:hypothetical protein
VAAAKGTTRPPTIVEGEIVSWSDTTIVVDFAGRPKEVTVSSVYGTAEAEVDNRGKPARKPRRLPLR